MNLYKLQTSARPGKIISLIFAPTYTGEADQPTRKYLLLRTVKDASGHTDAVAPLLDKLGPDYAYVLTDHLDRQNWKYCPESDVPYNIQSHKQAQALSNGNRWQSAQVPDNFLFALEDTVRSAYHKARDRIFAGAALLIVALLIGGGLLSELFW